MGPSLLGEGQKQHLVNRDFFPFMQCDTWLSIKLLEKILITTLIRKGDVFTKNPYTSSFAYANTIAYRYTKHVIWLILKGMKKHFCCSLVYIEFIGLHFLALVFLIMDFMLFLNLTCWLILLHLIIFCHTSLLSIGYSCIINLRHPIFYNFPYPDP